MPKLSLKWAFGFPDATSAWSQPTVAGGRAVRRQPERHRLRARREERLHPLDVHREERRAHRAVVRPARRRRRYAVYFGDTGANVYALDAATGRELWSRRLDEHLYARITGSPTLYQDRLYVPVSSMEETAASQQGYECCTFRGSLNALDVKTGAIVWQTFMVPPAQPAGKNAAGVALWGPSGVGIWSAPTIDVKRGLVYAGTGNTYSAPAQPTADAIVAFDLKSGAIKWIHQLTAGDVFGCRAGSANCGEKAGPDFDLGTPPMLITLAGGRDVIVVGAEIGQRVRDRSRQGGRAALAVSRRRGIDLGRHPVGRRRRRRARLLPGLRHPHAEAGRPARGRASRPASARGTCRRRR